MGNADQTQAQGGERDPDQGLRREEALDYVVCHHNLPD
jgi:hypothetical protein